MSDLHKTIRSMITEQFQGTATATGTATARATGVSSRALGGSTNVGTSTGSYTPSAGAGAAINSSPSQNDLIMGALSGNGEDQSGGVANYRTPPNVNAARARSPQPTAVPTTPIKRQQDNNVAQPEQSVSPSDLTTSIGIDPAMQLFQSARNALTLSAPNMGLNFGSAVQGIAAAYALGRQIFSGTQPANPQTQLSIKPQVMTSTKTTSGGTNMGSNLLGNLLAPPATPGAPGVPPPPKDEDNTKPLPSPTPLSNQSMKTDMFSSGEVAQMGGRPKAANHEEHNPKDRSSRFRQSSMFTITPDQAMNFIAKTESSDNSLKSLIREEIRRRIEEEVVKKPYTNNAKLSDEEIEQRLSPRQRRDIANKNKQSKKKPS